MSDLTYNVVVNLKTDGLSGFSAKIGSLNQTLNSTVNQVSHFHTRIGKMAEGTSGASQAFSELGRSAMAVGSSITGAFQGAVETVAKMGLALGAVGLTAAFAGIVHGVTGLNSHLEETQVSLATIFNANGITNSMQEGMAASSTLMDKMRKDAADLPGEFKDLVNIFQMAAMPGFKAGLSANKLEGMSAQVMAAAVATGGTQFLPTAAREFSLLLAGQSGGHNILGKKVFGLAGESAHEFNQMDAAKRVEFLQKGLEKFAPAIEVFKNTFVGLSSTLKDNFLRIGQVATQPVFERVKDVLKGANRFFDDNKTEVMFWANQIGNALDNAFSTGLKVIRDWYPAVKNFAFQAFSEIHDIWRKIEPLVRRVADHVRTSLGDVTAIKNLEKIAALYGASKVASAGSGLMGMLPSPAAFMGGGGAGELLGAMANPAGLIVLGSALVAVAGAVTVAVGAFSALNNNLSFFGPLARAASSDIDKFTTKIGSDLSKAFEDVYPGLQVFVEFFGTSFLNTVAIVTEGIAGATTSLRGFTSGLRDFIVQTGASLGLDWGHENIGIGKSNMTMLDHGLEQVLSKRQSDQDKVLNKTIDAVAGHGGTHVQKVEIVVTSNQDPSRIARAIDAHLSNLAKNPRSSRSSTNMSRARA